MSPDLGGASPRGNIARATPTAGARESLARAEARLRSEAPAVRELGLPALAHIAVVGAGAMGSTVAMAAAAAGLDVLLVDKNPARLQAARADISRWSAGAAAGTTVEYTPDLARISGRELVIESIAEDAALKSELLMVIEDHVGPATLITTNTSSLDIDHLAESMRLRGRFLGTHFFLPAHRIPVLELIRGSATTAKALEQARALAVRLSKIPVCVGNAPGFVGNRLFDHLRQEAVFMVEEGALPEEVDNAMENWGLALGPFATLDRIGLALIDSVATRQQATPGASVPSLITELCNAGRTGVTVRRGWFDYEPGSRRGSPSIEVRQLIERWSRDRGYARRAVPVDEIVTRAVLAVIEEARVLLARGIAGRPGDIDVLFTGAFGFPSWSGGPMGLAEALGTEALRDDAARFPLRRDARWLPPCATRPASRPPSSPLCQSGH
jgi:3-hydroxyacyl-CoA dehydrogenase